VPISRLREKFDHLVVYLRHDIDLDPLTALPFARAERALRCHATYFFPLTQPFNLFSAQNRSVLRKLSELGHEIGLHYDMEVYPRDVREAREYLELEISVLERLCGQEIRTITMHNPHRGGSDPFRHLAKYVNPHDSELQADLLYVSDSCRAWRDETLLKCFSENAPRRLLLLTHPELWLDGAIDDRMEYLEKVLLRRAISAYSKYLMENVAQVWHTHPGPRAHDARVARERKRKAASQGAE
jgi:hypothetical protein